MKAKQLLFLAFLSPFILLALSGCGQSNSLNTAGAASTTSLSSVSAPSTASPGTPTTSPSPGASPAPLVVTCDQYGMSSASSHTVLNCGSGAQANLSTITQVSVASSDGSATQTQIGGSNSATVTCAGTGCSVSATFQCCNAFPQGAYSITIWAQSYAMEPAGEMQLECSAKETASDPMATDLSGQALNATSQPVSTYGDPGYSFNYAGSPDGDFVGYISCSGTR
jgi:hypothetical protein